MRSDEQLHQIGTVAERVGLSLRTIRHYEEVDLIGSGAVAQLPPR